MEENYENVTLIDVYDLLAGQRIDNWRNRDATINASHGMHYHAKEKRVWIGCAVYVTVVKNRVLAHPMCQKPF